MTNTAAFDYSDLTFDASSFIRRTGQQYVLLADTDPIFTSSATVVEGTVTVAGTDTLFTADGTEVAPVKVTAVGPTGIAGIGDATTTLLELDATTLSGSTSDGQAVSDWTDASAFGNDATQTTSGAQPVFTDNVLNGQPVLRFDGANDLLDIANAASLNSGGQPYLQRAETIVFQTGSDISSRQVLYEEGAGARGFNLYLLATGHF